MNIINTIDEQGRIRIPEEIREFLGVYTGDQFKVMADGVNIILVRHSMSCLACNDDTNVQRVNKTFLCGECREAVAKTLCMAADS